MYNRNQLIYAKKKYNENLAEHPEIELKGATQLDTAIEQIDFLLTFINK